ncbi:MAG: glycosyltransferase family 4 protein [Terracidiphilus sp.]|jgi:Fuc2NAc and GlcNAc transferase
MILFALVFLVSALLTAGVRHYLLRRGIMDRPNARSSHATPVPRGGGIGIVLAFLCAVVWLVHEQAVPAGLASALVGGGIAIGLVGFLDDRFRMAAWPRLIVHLLAAAWAVRCFTAMSPGVFTGGPRGWFSGGVALLGLVWLTNLFNFMDGIDGLAGMEAATVSGLAALLLSRGGMPGDTRVCWMLAAASLGFLVWNWPPAKVFLGDVGSGFLGFSLGVPALFSSRGGGARLWTWLILLGAFLVDSTVTLLRRMLARERWYEAHRSHAYQHAARALGSHVKVTLAFAAINAGYLFPLAWCAERYPAFAPACAAAAAVPLLVLALRFHAGRKERSTENAAQD